MSQLRKGDVRSLERTVHDAATSTERDGAADAEVERYRFISDEPQEGGLGGGPLFVALVNTVPS